MESEGVKSTPPTLPVGDPQDTSFLTSDLRAALLTYLSEEEVAQAERAYHVSARAHQGQRRRSGEPYISHPMAVAAILAGMHMNIETINAAILHDVIEDTEVSKEDIVAQFGEEVAELVDGVSKLTQIDFESHQEAQAENLRKMLLAMVRDIRVIIIKLADRLHNMRTLGAMPLKKRRRISQETLDIYAPIANRLGMNDLRTELQDLSFAELHPMRFRILSEAIRKARGNRREIIGKIEATLFERLTHAGLKDFEVKGRVKHIYSLYQKMLTKHLSFNEVFDVYAFRITVSSVDACYRVLGMVHNFYKPVPGRFKDYIAIPKTNGYQSLHTVLFGPYGVHMEIQIRSYDMAKVADAGVAAHWLYKLGDGDSDSTQTHTRKWLSGLLDLQKNTGSSIEFLENVKIDLFPEEVYVFSPKGKILELPRGATVVDFAYAVHSDIGNTCVAAKVDRRLVPLSTPLSSGQTVEILTAPNAHPSPSWLNFVVSGKARSNIRHYLKNLEHNEASELGRRMLEKILRSRGRTLAELEPWVNEELLREFKLYSIERLFGEIGMGNRPAVLVAKRIEELSHDRPNQPRPRPHVIKDVLHRYMPTWLGGGRTNAHPLAIKGSEGMVVTYAKCCMPIPGDPIQGFISAGRGIVIHDRNCKNIKEFKNAPEKWVDVEWDADQSREYPVAIRILARNRRGVLATIAATIADMGVNTRDVVIGNDEGAVSSLIFTIDVKNRVHLARVMRRIRVLEDVVKITRKKA
ncbi:MAG: RelA/SpoT family protein [Gammaproteobacteria bacterium]|nr:RelA/SpoT family protein [Gammaproteobacteria bacterium]